MGTLLSRKMDCYKPVREGSFWSRSYVEYESNGDKNKTLLIKEYLSKIRPYLKDIIYDIKKSDTWKTIAINLTSSEGTDGECVMHSKSENIEIMIDD